MNIVDFNDEEQIKKDIEQARKKVDASPSKEKPAPKAQKPEPEAEKEEEVTKETIVKEVTSVILNVLICFVVVFLITQFVGQRTVVSGSSMEDTLSDGDNLVVDKVSYRFRDP